jgi:hypothetical protein
VIQLLLLLLHLVRDGGRPAAAASSAHLLRLMRGLLLWMSIPRRGRRVRLLHWLLGLLLSMDDR